MAVEACCRVLQQDEEIRNRILSSPAVCNSIESENPWEFRRIQLIAGSNLDAAVAQLNQRIATCIVEKPPYHFQWMSRTSVCKQMMVQYMTDDKNSAETVLVHHQQRLTDQQKADLLAFRGLLAHGVLVHCLKQRFRVNYGLKSRAVKRMAVPFQASDTPSEKNEFAHADSAIVLTYLSFYYDGLTGDQVRVCMSTMHVPFVYSFGCISFKSLFTHSSTPHINIL
jgi:hypothetical protein